MLSRNNAIESENQLVSRYLDGLKDSTNDEIGCRSIFILFEAQNLAVKAELRLSLKKILGVSLSIEFFILFVPLFETIRRVLPKRVVVRDSGRTKGLLQKLRSLDVRTPIPFLHLIQSNLTIPMQDQLVINVRGAGNQDIC